MTQETLYIILLCFVVVSIFVLIAIAIGYMSKNKNKNTGTVKKVTTSAVKNPKTMNEKQTVPAEDKQAKKISDMKNMDVDFVENFMEFDEISDNMIIQNKGDKYIMVIKCQGINYDLMSSAEMVAVEEGFIQFLNTLRFPIQLYVQTSSLDLTDSLREYNERIEENHKELASLQLRLKRMEEFEDADEDDLDAIKYEIRKKQNIYEYGMDVVEGVERISKNKNILKQNYYVVVPYFASELGGHNFTQEEIKEMAFSELYTRCKGLIGALQVCSVEGKILNSFELAELLYLSYNRDEGEIYSFRNAIEAQYDRLYHTAPDVMEKRMAILENEILETAASQANEQIIKAAGFLPGDVEENNEMIQRLIYENQKEYIKDYTNLIDDDIIKAAIKNTTAEYRESKKQVNQNGENQEIEDDMIDEQEDYNDEEEIIEKPKTRKRSSKKKQDVDIDFSEDNVGGEE